MTTSIPATTAINSHIKSARLHAVELASSLQMIIVDLNKLSSSDYGTKKELALVLSKSEIKFEDFDCIDTDNVPQVCERIIEFLQARIDTASFITSDISRLFTKRLPEIKTDKRDFQ